MTSNTNERRNNVRLTNEMEDVTKEMTTWR